MPKLVYSLVAAQSPTPEAGLDSLNKVYFTKNGKYR